MSGRLSKYSNLNRPNNNFCNQSEKKYDIRERRVIQVYSNGHSKMDIQEIQCEMSSKLYERSTSKSSSASSFYTESGDSDTEHLCPVEKLRPRKKKIPPIGVFWDIENCQVPKGKSAVAVAQLIRDSFFTGYREAEFLVVCDVRKENVQLIQELNDAQVTLVHVASTCKNAADEKLRQALRRFADIHGTPAAIILISGDINFAADLSDLRHRKKLHVILVHKDNASDALILCASEHYNYNEITQVLPLKESKTTSNNEPMEVTVHNLPAGIEATRIRNRLRQISDNCGGRVVSMSLEMCTAVVRFSNLDSAIRAQRRMDGEDVYGNKVSVSYPTSVRNWDKSYSPYKMPVRRVNRNSDMYVHPAVYGMPPPPPNVPYQHPSADGFNPVQNQYKSMMEQSVNVVQNTQQDMMSFTSIEQYQARQYSRPPKNVVQNVPMAPIRSESSRCFRTHSAMVSEFPSEQWRPHSASFSEGQRRSRTPKDICTTNKQTWYRNVSGSFTSLNTLENEDIENHFQPVTLVRSNSMSNGQNSSAPVELLVTNLDQTLEPQELKSLLLSMFQEHVMMINLNLFHQSDGNLAASVRVSSAQDAQYVISQLHRRKVGHKRILISNAQSSFTNPQVLRTQVIALLQEVPGNRMPLFKFRELLETRYRSSVSVSELYKLRDVCFVSEETCGRMISLSPDLRTTPSPHLNSQSGVEAHCIIHCPNGLSERGWAEPEAPPLPNIRFQLKVFTTRVHELLHSHMGSLPLPSFPVCYEIETREKLPIDESGVPLEHLVTCVVGVELRLSPNMVKYIMWGKQSSGEETHQEDGSSTSSLFSAPAPMKCVSPPLATQLALFSRELVDLLRTAPHCQLPFSRFIPAYHHHFGRQCRVADYGYTKLVDLFDSLSHIIQIIGEGNKRLITLSHSAQVRRFTSDLLRVLKTQASKQVTMTEFPAAYERVLQRPFDPVDYGLCELTDLLNEVSENVVVIKNTLDEIFIAIPKREQTADEMMKTRQFAVEVVDLLRHAPQYGMLFNKFVPAYHHHYGHQCRVSDYGFTKLIELFEAIPEVVKIEETSNGERRVSLTEAETLKVVRDQIVSLIKSSRLQSIPLVALPGTFLREHGYPLRPDLYECSTTEDLIVKLSDSLQLVSSAAGPTVILVEETSQQQLGLRIWALLLKPPHSASVVAVQHDFQVRNGYPCSVEQMEKYRSIIELKCTNKEMEVTLTPRYALAARLYHLLYENGGSLLLGNVDGMYLRKYGKVLRPNEYDATTLNALLSQLSFLVVVRGRRNKRNVALNTSITSIGVPLPPNMKYAYSDGPSTNGGNNVVQWPPPPAHTYLFNSGRTIVSPPKPDTPPTHGNFHWDSPNFSSSPNLCIPLPFMHTPPLMDNSNTLISPMKYLLPAYPTTSTTTTTSTSSTTDQLKPPEPNELPMPGAELLCNKGKITSPSKDSGIGCTSFCNSLEEPDSSTNIEPETNTPSKKKRQIRLAANFPTPLNIT